MKEIAARRLLPTPIGLISIATTEKGVAALDILRPVASLAEFSASDSAREIAELAAGQLREYFDQDRTKFEVPIDVGGTQFQEAVWSEISKIGFGKTLSYGQIAERIGRPKGSRPVGGAVGANPVPIIIPCHRVMGSSGKITGYSGGEGIATKIQLLDLEGIAHK